MLMLFWPILLGELALFAWLVVVVVVDELLIENKPMIALAPAMLSLPCLECNCGDNGDSICAGSASTKLVCVSLLLLLLPPPRDATLPLAVVDAATPVVGVLVVCRLEAML